MEGGIYMKQSRHVLPGFQCSLGFTVTYVSIVILVPMGLFIGKGLTMGWDSFIHAVWSYSVLHAYLVTFGAALVAASINAVFGCLLAWILVRYDFPFKRLVDGLIDLPFALPTAVAGISLTALYSPTGWIGSFFYGLGIETAFSVIGITIALVFVGIPFVVRTVQPVLREFDHSYEEGALMLGASQWKIFTSLILPEIRPALLTGFALALARAIGEYGSVVFISGNMPNQTEIAPLLIMSMLERFDYNGATAIAMVLLSISFIMLLGINVYQSRLRKRYGGSYE